MRDPDIISSPFHLARDNVDVIGKENMLEGRSGSSLGFRVKSGSGAGEGSGPWLVLGIKV